MFILDTQKVTFDNYISRKYLYLKLAKVCGTVVTAFLFGILRRFATFRDIDFK